jgi:hypothetical protein
MTSPLFEVRWSDSATADWMRLSFEDAEAVARAVRRFGETAEGLVIFADGEYRLFVGTHVVVFLIDGDALHVDRVRRFR